MSKQEVSLFFLYVHSSIHGALMKAACAVNPCEFNFDHF